MGDLSYGGAASAWCSSVTSVVGSTFPFEVLVGCIISIRTRDEVTLPTARRLFALARTPAEMSRLTPDEIEDTLREAGAAGLRRLSRGADFDRVEAIHRGDPYAVEKYGVGENRYVFSKG